MPAKPPLVWDVFGASVRGTAHAREGRPNQDALQTWSDAALGHAIVVVSDGHGGAPHPRSAVGAQLATESALAVLGAYLLTPHPPSPSQQARLVHEIGEHWQAEVTAHLQTMPLTRDEVALTKGATASTNPTTVAYGATLLAIAATREWLLILQLGDGDVLAVTAAGSTRRPLPHDPRLVGGRTLSLCQPEAWGEARSAVVAGDDMPILLLAATDGYADSFHTDADFLAIGGDYLSMLRAEPHDTRLRLPDILENASTHGSADDVTLGVLHRLG